MSNSASTAALFQHDAQRRILVACVCVSVALHAFVLAFPGRHSTSITVNSRVLTAQFAPQATEAQRRTPETASARPRREKEVPSVPTSPPPVPVPQKTEAVPVPDPSPSLPGTEQPMPTEASRATGAPLQFPGDEVTPRFPAELPDDAATRREYLVALVEAAKRYMRYPAQARERGWEGRVEVRLVIDAKGSIKSAIVKSSSRYRILDDQALEMVKKGQPLLQIPAALRGREFSVDIPVTFELLTG
jgi:protein TonB